jgi:hypothetical protein
VSLIHKKYYLYPPVPVHMSEIQKTKSGKTGGIKCCICQYMVSWGFQKRESRNLQIASKNHLGSPNLGLENQSKRYFRGLHKIQTIKIRRPLNCSTLKKLTYSHRRLS